MGEPDGIGVAEVIRQLRGDLSYAQWQGEDKSLRFELGPIELEFTVVIDSSRTNGARAKLWVVDAGTEGKRSSQHTHRIKLALQPVDEHGVKTTVAGRPVDGEVAPDSGPR